MLRSMTLGTGVRIEHLARTYQTSADSLRWIDSDRYYCKTIRALTVHADADSSVKIVIMTAHNRDIQLNLEI